MVNESGKQPYLSVLYSMFLHGGWLHILGNMLFLCIFGNNVEDRFGRLKFLLFYLFCGYVAAYGFAYGNPDSTTTLVGASGAIAGVLGAYLVMFPRARVMSLIPIAIVFIPIRLPAWLVLGGWFLLQWLYSSGSGVASGAGRGLPRARLRLRRRRARGPAHAPDARRPGARRYQSLLTGRLTAPVAAVTVVAGWALVRPNCEVTHGVLGAFGLVLAAVSG